MAITHKGSIVEEKQMFEPSEIYGGLGALANLIVGGPRRTGAEVNPDAQEVTVYSSYGVHTVEGKDINYDSTCRQLGLRYTP